MSSAFLSDPNAIQSLLGEWDNFEECLLRDVRWLDFGTSLDFVLTRPPRWGEVTVVIHAVMVRELHLSNLLTEELVRDPSRMDWGYSEIELIRVEEVPGLSGPDPWMIRIVGFATFGNSVRFSVVCSGIAVRG